MNRLTIEELQVLITGETSQLKKELEGVKRQLEQTDRDVKKSTGRIGASLKRLAGLFASIFAIKTIIEFGRRSVQAFNAVSVEVTKLERVMKNTMGATAAQVQSVKDLAAAQEQIGVIGADIQFSGAQELGTYLSDVRSLKTLLPTLNDMLAQQYGMDATSEAAVNIGSMIGKVMEGQLGALSRYGYSWDAAQEKVLKHGNELERAAMLAEVIGQSVGGMNEELGKTPVGQMRQLAFTFGAIKEELGRGLTPVLQRILPYLQSVAQWLLRITQFVSMFLQTLFGSSAQSTKGITAQTGAVEDLGDAYEKTGKKARKSVSGFDQLNLVGGEANNGADKESGGVGGIDLGVDTGPFEEVGNAMSDVQRKAQEMASKVKAAYGGVKDFIKENSDIIVAALTGVGVAFGLAFGIAKWGAIVETLKKIGVAILTAFRVTPIGLIITAISLLAAGFVYLWRTNEDFRNVVTRVWETIKTALLQVWENVLVPFGAWLKEIMPIAWDAVSKAAIWLWKNALVPLGNFVKQLWDNVMKPFGAWLKDIMPVAWNAVVKAAEWLWKNILVPFGEFLKWLWKDVLVPIGKVIGEYLVIAFETVLKIASSFWKDVLIPLGKALAEMFGPAIEAVTAVLTWLWKEVFVPFGQFIKNVIMPIIGGLVKIFEFLWKNVLKPLVNFLSDVVVSVFRNAFKSIGDLIGGIKTTFIGLMNFITGIFTNDWRKAWEGVKGIFKGVFESLWSIVKYPLNLIIDGINAVINGLNKISFDIPDWVPGIGGKNFGINIPKIPKLAVGTNYVKNDGLAFLHEGEAVVPKKYNPAAGGNGTGGDNREVVSVLRLILAALTSGNNGNDGSNVNFTDFVREITKEQNSQNRRVGMTLNRI